MLIYMFREWRRKKRLHKLLQERDTIMEGLLKGTFEGNEKGAKQRWVEIEFEMRCLEDESFAKEQKRITKLNKEKLIAKRKKK